MNCVKHPVQLIHMLLNIFLGLLNIPLLLKSLNPFPSNLIKQDSHNSSPVHFANE